MERWGPRGAAPAKNKMPSESSGLSLSIAEFFRDSVKPFLVVSSRALSKWFTIWLGSRCSWLMLVTMPHFRSKWMEPLFVL